MNSQSTLTPVGFSSNNPEGTMQIVGNDSAETLVKKSSPQPHDYRWQKPARKLDPDTVTNLDLSEFEEAKRYILYTGCLPKWIVHFRNLQVLNAARMRVMILEPWLLELEHLQVLYLEQNHISTWPHFLCQAKTLKIVCLDGNPCLEKAFSKSHSLRSTYFSWMATKDTTQSVPSYIRGPEWFPAASTRLNRSSVLKDLGFYCGGIYTLTTPPNTSDDGLLTPLEPDLLERRNCNPRKSSSDSHTESNPKDPSSSSIKAPGLLWSTSRSTIASRWMNSSPIGWKSATSALTSSSQRFMSKPSEETSQSHTHHMPPVLKRNSSRKLRSLNEIDENKLDQSTIGRPHSPKNDEKQSRILFEIFEDISALMKRYEEVSDQHTEKYVYLVGGPRDICNRLLPDCTRLSICAMRQYCSTLLEEEDIFIEKLQLVNKHFCNADIKSLNISNILRAIFAGFPAMLSIRVKYIRPNLKNLTRVLEKVEQIMNNRMTYGRSDPQRKQARIDSLITAVCVELRTAFRRLHFVVQAYSSNICHAEFLLNSPRSILKLYEDANFGAHVRSQVARVGGGLVGHLGVGMGAHASAAVSLYMGSNNSDSPDIVASSTALSSWLEKRSHLSFLQDLNHPMDYIYLPLVRIVRMERFFTSLARSNELFRPLLRTLRYLRRLSASEVEISRQKERVRILTLKFRTTASCFHQYQWDALLAVRTRSYFEQGILEKNTNDVIDYNNVSASFVKETFSESKMRVLRLICCNGKIQIWDEVLEQLVGRIPLGKLLVIDPNNKSLGYHRREPGRKDEVRLLFVDARETCLVKVKGFTAKYVNTANFRQEFIDACQINCKESL